ncbi:hypothetical protein DUNSADRAFT_1157 [Dunaliella salina]|uniref:Uncharacterized protein n=1 Tax=Dunaliella salina TaxID=3046 RepID=A0ABQ7GXF5_DUNSA|nr:hypothetical protein DUNSADRAFT_1157 [Dunaliella salina]|eukprot:KAF5839284.1 hypothetical protein DUNSADRAFT_1157 [Dunaliella salina]
MHTQGSSCFKLGASTLAHERAQSYQWTCPFGTVMDARSQCAYIQGSSCPEAGGSCSSTHTLFSRSCSLLFFNFGTHIWQQLPGSWRLSHTRTHSLLLFTLTSPFYACMHTQGSSCPETGDLVAAAAEKLGAPAHETASSQGDRAQAAAAQQEGSFIQEPGSGVRATVGDQVVLVGTLEWVQRQGAQLPTDTPPALLQEGAQLLPMLPILEPELQGGQGAQGAMQLSAQGSNQWHAGDSGQRNPGQRDSGQQDSGQGSNAQGSGYANGGTLSCDGDGRQRVQGTAAGGFLQGQGHQQGQGHREGSANHVHIGSSNASRGLGHNNSFRSEQANSALDVSHGGLAEGEGGSTQAKDAVQGIGEGNGQKEHREGRYLTPAAAQLPQSGAVSSVHGVGSSHSRVFVGVGDRVVGAIDVQDALRSDAQQTVADLHRLGVRTVMLSGDREGAAHEVAASVGISPKDVYPNVKPAGKAALVEQLQSEGRRVAMVGDGINDTAALAAAHVGVAMGGGVDAASEVAKVVLMGDHLHQVTDAIHLSRSTLNKIRQNLFWALGYNLVAIPLAAGALLPSMGICLTPSLSGAMMGASSVLVVSNSLLLQWELRGMRQPSTSASSAHSSGPPPRLQALVVHGVDKNSSMKVQSLQS